jgi:hypothetical protein
VWFDTGDTDPDPDPDPDTGAKVVLLAAKKAARSACHSNELRLTRLALVLGVSKPVGGGSRKGFSGDELVDRDGVGEVGIERIGVGGWLDRGRADGEDGIRPCGVRVRTRSSGASVRV